MAPGETLSFSLPFGDEKWGVRLDVREKCVELNQGPVEYTLTYKVFGPVGNGSTASRQGQASGGYYFISIVVPPNAKPGVGGVTLIDMYLVGHCGVLGVYSATAQWGPYTVGDPAKDRHEHCRNLVVPKTFDDLVDLVIACDVDTVFNPNSTLDERLVAGIFLLPAFKVGKGVPSPVRRQLLKELWEQIERIGATQARKPKTTKALQTILEIGTKKGNIAAGRMTRAEVDELGRIWVGPGARQITEGGKGLVSKDGTRVYRFPAEKPKLGGKVQANLEERVLPATRKGAEKRVPVNVRNAHVDITD